MFVMTINRTIGHELFLKQSGLDDDQGIIVVKDICPGCGSKVNVNERECAECGLCFGGE
jgi:ribosomal protein S27AE